MPKEPPNLRTGKHVEPREYMSSTRPELFSDTDSSSRGEPDRNQVEYFFDTLTSRKQEQPFEEFCRRLAEREVCPNLKPQTGPTAGGDSKTDASTYPVASSLVERRYWGSPNQPSKENWAFAMSCQKSWPSKVKADIKKIVTLPEKPTKIFFFSNQLIRDKKRAETERKLTEEFGTEVHIFDLNWILGKVFGNKHYDLLEETLGYKLPELAIPKLGPRDSDRARRLDETLSKLKKPDLYLGNDYAIALDFLKSAKLARSLEKPRIEVDGLFEQGRQLASKRGFRELYLKISYNQAWTSFFWFNDRSKLAQIYSDMERLLSEVEDADDLEYFSNLTNLLITSFRQGKISAADAKIDERVKSVLSKLDECANDDGRPNNAMHAQILSLHLQLTQAYQAGTKTTELFGKLRKCFKECSGLGNFPALDFANTYTELGDTLGHLDGYDDFFDEICLFIKDRTGESEEGKLLLRRGLQALKAEQHHKALDFLTRASNRLGKNESMGLAVRACLASSHVYSALGYYWAARLEGIVAAHLTIRSFKTINEFPVEAIRSALQMGWFEISVGRVAPYMAWSELASLILAQLRGLGIDLKNQTEELELQERLLGCMILGLQDKDAQELRPYLDPFERMQMHLAHTTLLYRLGDHDAAKREMPIDLTSSDQEYHSFFKAWKDHKAGQHLPKSLSGETRNYCEFQTEVRGVTFNVKVKNTFELVAHAENILGLIEALLVQIPWQNLAFIRDEISINIDTAEGAKSPPSVEYDSFNSNDRLDLTYGVNFADWIRSASRDEITTHLLEVFINVFFIVSMDPEKEIKKEFRDLAKKGVIGRLLGLLELTRFRRRLIYATADALARLRRSYSAGLIESSEECRRFWL